MKEWLESRRNSQVHMFWFRTGPKRLKVGCHVVLVVAVLGGWRKRRRRPGVKVYANLKRREEKANSWRVGNRCPEENDGRWWFEAWVAWEKPALSKSPESRSEDEKMRKRWCSVLSNFWGRQDFFRVKLQQPAQGSLVPLYSPESVALFISNVQWCIHSNEQSTAAAKKIVLVMNVWIYRKFAVLKTLWVVAMQQWVCCDRSCDVGQGSQQSSWRRSLDSTMTCNNICILLREVEACADKSCWKRLFVGEKLGRVKPLFTKTNLVLWASLLWWLQSLDATLRLQDAYEFTIS